MAREDDDDKDLELEDKEPEAEDKESLPKDDPNPDAPIEVKVGAPGTRAEKKRNRLKELEQGLNERTTRAEQEAQQARREAQEANQRLQALQQHPQSGRSEPQNPQFTQLQQRLGQIAEAKRRLQDQFEAVASRPGWDPRGKDAAEYKRYWDDAENLENARVAAIHSAQQPQQVNQQELVRQIRLQSYLDSHSDVTHDQQKMNWAYARWQQKLAEGYPDTVEMADETMDEARVKFGLKPRMRRQAPVDPAARRRLTGLPSQGSQGSAQVGAVTMGKQEKRMARAMYDKDPPEVAYQKWANGPGKRAAEKRLAK